MGGSGKNWLLPVVAVAILGAICWMIYAMVDTDSPNRSQATVDEERRAARKRALDEKRRRFKRALATRNVPREAPDPQPRARSEKVDKSEEPARLSSNQQLAIKSAVDSFYSPQDLAEALRTRTAADYSREVTRKYLEMYSADEIDSPQGPVPMTPEVKKVMRHVGVLKDYVMNMLHTMRPEGEEALQQQMMDRINESIGRRVDLLNEDYPWLDISKVESL